jgi:hypothetical protein
MDLLLNSGRIMKSVIVIGLLVLLCVSSFAADRNKLAQIKDLDRQISDVVTNETGLSIQREELRRINRELDYLVVNETDPEVVSLYDEVKTRLRDLYPGIR